MYSARDRLGHAFVSGFVPRPTASGTGNFLRSLAGSQAATLLTTGIILLLSLATSIMLARMLGPEGRGLLLALTFWPTLLTGVLSLSLNEGANYHIAQFSSGLRVDAVNSTAFWLVLTVTTVGALIILPLLWLVVPEQYRVNFELICAFALAFMLLGNLMSLYRAVIQGQGQLARLNLMRLVQPLSYFVLLAGVFAWGSGLGVRVVMGVMLAAMAISTLVGIAITWFPIHLFRRRVAKGIMATSWRFHKANLVLYASAEIDKAIVLLFLPTAQVGLYAVAVSVSAIGSGLVIQSLGLVLMREMAQAKTGLERHAIFVGTMRSSTFLLVVINGSAALLAKWWVPAMFGEEFRDAIIPAILLLVAGGLKGMRLMLDKVLRATEHTRTGVIGEVAALASMVPLGSWGAYAAGIKGFSVGIIVAQLIALTVSLSMAKQYRDFKYTELFAVDRNAMTASKITELFNRKGR